MSSSSFIKAINSPSQFGTEHLTASISGATHGQKTIGALNTSGKLSKASMRPEFSAHQLNDSLFPGPAAQPRSALLQAIKNPPPASTRDLIHAEVAKSLLTPSHSASPPINWSDPTAWGDLALDVAIGLVPLPAKLAALPLLATTKAASSVLKHTPEVLQKAKTDIEGLLRRAEGLKEQAVSHQKDASELRSKLMNDALERRSKPGASSKPPQGLVDRLNEAETLEALVSKRRLELLEQVNELRKKYDIWYAL